MDFLKILKSIEEFVYEALTWLILLPQTLVRIVLRPRHMVGYAERELARDDEDRFGDAISPPLLLILCILVSHAVDLAIRPQTPWSSSPLAGMVMGSEQTLLLFRTMVFGLWAMTGSVWLLASRKQPINRRHLRDPFYEQCYLTAPFALLLSVGFSLTLVGGRLVVPGLVTALLATLWFWIAQVQWIRDRAGYGLGKGMVAATGILLVGMLVNTGVSLVMAQSPPPAEATEQTSH